VPVDSQCGRMRTSVFGFSCETAARSFWMISIDDLGVVDVPETFRTEALSRPRWNRVVVSRVRFVDEGELETSDGRDQEYALIGRLGQTVAAVFEPLGFDWRSSVGVMTSFCGAGKWSLSTLSDPSDASRPERRRNPVLKDRPFPATGLRTGNPVFHDGHVCQFAWSFFCRDCSA